MNYFSLLIGVSIGILIFLVMVIVLWKPKPFDFGGKTFLITGGSEGIGLEMARILRKKKGCNLILVARNVAKLEKAKAELESEVSGSERWIRCISLDVSADFEILSSTFEDELEGETVHGIICNAGVSIAGDVRSLDPSEFERMMRINYLGSILVVKALLDLNIFTQLNGRIAFVSSQAGQLAIWGYGAYGASKYALR